MPTSLQELAARWALYGPPDGPPQANHQRLRAIELSARLHQSFGALRELDLTGVAPASVFRITDSVELAPRESSDAAL